MKKILVLICIILCIFTVTEIITSFGVFESSFSEDSEVDVAKWHIYVNNSSLNDTENVFYVNNITYTNNQHVSANRFAPGVSGSFLIEIDPTDTEVSFKYELSIDLSSNQYSQIRVDNIEGISGTSLTVQDGVYSRIFRLSEIQAEKKDLIRVTFSWINNDANNDSDSLLGMSDGNIEIPVNIKFSQYVE